MHGDFLSFMGSVWKMYQYGNAILQNWNLENTHKKYEKKKDVS